ncbi:MAG: SUMF1/EgtB/PvdO family nonheme iron enzyme, partial [Planctomycetota bacterium]
MFTEIGQVVGTPEYMAPEQADPTNQDVDTRADVYSIGVMAYEVLTGQLPFSANELRAGGMMEAQRLLREVDPPKPSTRLSQLGESASAVATARRISSSALMRTLKSDLDWVVLKALEKDRARRYESADALSMDLQRYLLHEPVVAGPPSTWYRAQKLVRRYRTQFVSLALVLGALGTGLVLAVTSWNEAEARRVEADEQRRIATDNLKNFQRLRDDVRLQQFTQRAKAFTETSRDAEGMASWEREVETWLGSMDDHEKSLAALRASATKEADGTYRFADPGDQFLHDALTRLIDGWKAFRSENGEQKRVARMRQWAEQVRKKTIDEHGERWAKAKAEIAANPNYAGLQITPQEGLVPLGIDPDSGDNKLQAFAYLRSAGEGCELELPEEVDENSPVVFVLIPGGAATIGNPRGDSMPVESPAQTVGLAPYFLAKHELTQAQWSRLSDVPNPSRFSEARGFGGANRHPVESISWLEANDLARRHGLVLPTEAQWEYGCRAGTTWRWWMGDDKDAIAPLRADGYRDGRFNAADGFRKRKSNVEDAEFFPDLDDGYQAHVWVDEYEANPFGLYNVHGNVAELTRDAFAG